jgi:hypothetical protein
MQRCTMNILVALATVSLLLSINLTSSAQGISPIVDSSYVLYNQVAQLTSFPPLNTGMPFDVLIGYIYLDSLRRQSPRSVDSFVSRLTNSDTLRNALKYLYEMDDYNPITFLQYAGGTPAPGHYKNSGARLRAMLINQATIVIPDTNRTAMLGSDIIVHVLVTNLESKYDSSYGCAFPNQVIVTCRVIDTVKGRVLPSCVGGATSKDNNLHTLTTSNCFQFCYSPQEHLWGNTTNLQQRPLMVDSLGNPWVKLNSEYLAFLDLQGVGGDSLRTYYTVCLATKYQTTQGCLYRISSGKVIDPNNDFGFGVNLSTSDYLSALRARIYRLTHP